jgi:PAS domain S-box-containing protein
MAPRAESPRIDTRHVRGATEQRHVRGATEERLRILLASLPYAVLAVDDSGSIVSAEGRVQEIFGAEPAALVGSPVESLVPDAHRSAHEHKRREFLATPSARTMGSRDLVARRIDGVEIPVDIALSPVVIDGRPLVLATVADVTERRAYRQALEEREHDLEEAQQVARVGSWTLHPRTGQATWSLIRTPWWQVSSRCCVGCSGRTDSRGICG